MHWVSKVVYCKVNLHQIDASDLTTQDLDDILALLAEQEAADPRAAERNPSHELEEFDLNSMDMPFGDFFLCSRIVEAPRHVVPTGPSWNHRVSSVFLPTMKEIAGAQVAAIAFKTHTPSILRLNSQSLRPFS